jgi:two-component system chemotaxis response regulator CheB
MAGSMRLIIASKQTEMVSAIKNSVVNKTYIESIINVPRPADAENKLNRAGINVLVWDLDENVQNAGLSASMQNRGTLYTVYTSLSSGKYPVFHQSGNDVFVQKPAIFTPITSVRFSANFVEKLDAMVKRQTPPNMRELNKMVTASDKQKIVAIGSSTGGTNALEDLLKRLPIDMPPMVVVQHMPSTFTKLFADRLNALYSQEIREAQSGDFLMRGKMLIAPADRHMKIVQQQGKLAVECFVGNRIHGVMPAADVLFESVAKILGANAVGVILTGMGNDGAKGLMQMRAAGAKNIGQDEASCVVYGMPKAAKDIGAIHTELPLDKIPDEIMRLSRG